MSTSAPPASAAASASASCANCGAPLHGPFCAACGQEDLPLAPSLRDVVREATHEMLDVDGRTVRSIRALLLSPGLLTRELFAGHRVPWLSPLKLYLIFSVFYFAMTALGGSSVKINVKNGDRVETDRALQTLGFGNEADFRLAIGRAQAAWMPRVMFLLVPLFGGLVSIARRDSRRTYPQHLQFALHAHAAWFAVRGVSAAAPLARLPVLPDALGAVTMVYGIVYVFLAMRTAYGGTKRRALLHTAIILGVYGLILSIATLAIIMPILRPFMTQKP